MVENSLNAERLKIAYGIETVRLHHQKNELFIKPVNQFNEANEQEVVRFFPEANLTAWIESNLGKLGGSPIPFSALMAGQHHGLPIGLFVNNAAQGAILSAETQLARPQKLMNSTPKIQMALTQADQRKLQQWRVKAATQTSEDTSNWQVHELLPNNEAFTCIRQVELVDGIRLRFTVDKHYYNEYAARHGSWSELQELYAQTYEGKLIPFNESGLPHNLGVATMVVTQDGFVAYVNRNSANVEVAFGPNCTASGAVKWNQGMLLESGIMGLAGHQIATETHEEIGVTHAYDSFTETNALKLWGRGIYERCYTEIGIKPWQAVHTLLGIVREQTKGQTPEAMFCTKFLGTKDELTTIAKANNHSDAAETGGVFFFQPVKEAFKMAKKGIFIAPKGRLNLLLMETAYTNGVLEF